MLNLVDGDAKPRSGTHPMMIDCSQCDCKVKGSILAVKEYGPCEFSEKSQRIYFAECPACDSVLLCRSETFDGGEDGMLWSDPERIWPDPIPELHFSIPYITRSSLEEAKTCYKAKAYRACAVMCGRALEGICHDNSTKKENLAAGLKELRERGIIDQRLFEWSESLRELRNVSAHAGYDSVSKQDAGDVYDFALAICEYIYVLTEKYEDFRNRSLERDALRKRKIELLEEPDESDEDI